MSINKNIIITITTLIFTIIFFGLTSIDTIVEDMFYNSMTQSWILDRDLQPYRFIFYDGIKKLLIIFALLFLASLIFFRKNPTIQAYKRGIMVVVLSAIFVPRTVGGVNYPIAKDDWASCFTEP